MLGSSARTIARDCTGGTRPKSSPPGVQRGPASSNGLRIRETSCASNQSSRMIWFRKGARNRTAFAGSFLFSQLLRLRLGITLLPKRSKCLIFSCFADSVAQPHLKPVGEQLWLGARHEARFRHARCQGILHHVPQPLRMAGPVGEDLAAVPFVVTRRACRWHKTRQFGIGFRSPPPVWCIAIAVRFGIFRSQTIGVCNGGQWLGLRLSMTPSGRYWCISCSRMLSVSCWPIRSTWYGERYVDGPMSP